MAGEAVLLFDGQCALCNACVDFVLQWDRNAVFRFAPLQSPAGQRLRARLGVPAGVDSLVLVRADRFWIRSSAALGVLRLLPLPWPLFYAYILVPRPLRDAAYDWIAVKRLAWFGRLERCRIPNMAEKPRFLD
jgi:predicted DCC family thiol-disulfide oxidoreductase YuxK